MENPQPSSITNATAAATSAACPYTESNPCGQFIEPVRARNIFRCRRQDICRCCCCYTALFQRWTVLLLLLQLLCVLPEPLKFFWFLSERREEIAAELVMSPFLIIFLPTESRSAEIRLSGLVGSSYGLSSTCVVVVVVWGL